MAFGALVAWLDGTLVPLDQLRSDAPRRWKIANVLLLWLAVALPLSVFAIVNVAGRALSHGRFAPTVDSSTLRLGGFAVVAVGTFASAVAVIGALTEIV